MFSAVFRQLNPDPWGRDVVLPEQFRQLKTEPEVIAALLMCRRPLIRGYLEARGTRHVPLASWSGRESLSIGQAIRSWESTYLIPVPLFGEDAWRAAFEGLVYVRQQRPADRVRSADWFYPILALSKDRPTEPFLRVLTSFAARVDQDRCLDVLMWYCGYPRLPSHPLPPSDVLSSPWLDPAARYCLCDAYGRGAQSFISAMHTPFITVYSASFVASLLKSPSLRDTLIAALHGPWVVDEPERLEALLPFVTSSSLYPEACAAVRHAALYDELRKLRPESFLDIPWISVGKM